MPLYYSYSSQKIDYCETVKVNVPADAVAVIVVVAFVSKVLTVPSDNITSNVQEIGLNVTNRTPVNTNAVAVTPGPIGAVTVAVPAIVSPRIFYQQLNRD
jgi:hypothetical protein